MLGSADVNQATVAARRRWPSRPGRPKWRGHSRSPERVMLTVLAKTITSGRLNEALVSGGLARLL